jgi:hypothetical protein
MSHGGSSHGQKQSKSAAYNANEVIFDNYNYKHTKEDADIVNRGDEATEPPYSNPEMHRTVEVAEALYAPLGSHARGVRIHHGSLQLRDAKKPPYRVGWVHSDKQYSPCITFSEMQPRVPKSSGPPKLWLPKELHEPKKKGKKDSGPKHSYSEGDIKASHKKLAERPRWDTEHHIMVSQANPEVQKFVREYFDKPVRKESEGIPKVRELYTMNDHQSGWWDEASPLGQSKHTYLDNAQPWNVGGPKVNQLPAYWRRIAEKGSYTEATPDEKQRMIDNRKCGSLIDRLADMPAAQSTQFWRDWVDLSKKRLPQVEPDPRAGKKKKKGLLASSGADKAKTNRGGWPAPPDSPSDTQASVATVPIASSSSAPALPKKEPEEWNDRWHVTASKDNPYSCRGHRQLFSSAQFLSGAEDGHPGAMLGLASQQWRKTAKNVTLAPSGVASRGSHGRRCLLV